MNTLSIKQAWPGPISILREAWTRQRELTLLALILLTAMIPTAVAYGLDPRELRGVNVWIKSLKFMAAIALFSFSTAWFIGLLPVAKRHTPAIRFIVTSLVGASLLEIIYIVVQAAQGQASHYNFSDLRHLLLYMAMGLGALLMCATQAVLALQISRYGREDIDPAWRMAVVRGLWLTLLLGAGVGILLSRFQPPDGGGLPLTGWHGSQDLRPAHFLGMHAQQFLPFVGFLLVGRPASDARRVLNIGVIVYVALWLGLVWMGMHDAHLKPMTYFSSVDMTSVDGILKCIDNVETSGVTYYAGSYQKMG